MDSSLPCSIYVPRQRRRAGATTKKARQSVDCQAFSSVGVTGFEPATTRPPDVYSKVEYTACAQHISFLPYKAVDFSVDSTVKG